MAKIIITPPGRFALPRAAELWEAREVLYRFGARDVTLRYRQTFLGVAWVVLQPLVTALVFTLVFNHVAHLTVSGVPYLVFSFVGLLAWNMFSGIVGRAQGSLVANRDLVSKVFFPRMLVPLATVYSNFVVFAVSLGFLVILWIAYGVNPGFQALLTPIWAVMLILLASGVGLITSALTVRYRDINYFVPFMLQFLLYATPIAYPLSAVHNYKILFEINPLTWSMQEFQWSLAKQPAPAPWEFALSIIVPIVLFLGSTIIFEQMERGFADVI